MQKLDEVTINGVVYAITSFTHDQRGKIAFLTNTEDEDDTRWIYVDEITPETDRE